MGGIASVANVVGPFATGLAWGNLVLSLITVWLGLRSAKAGKVWHSLKPDN